MMSAEIIPLRLGCELCSNYDYVNGYGWCKQKRDGITYCSKIPFHMRKHGCSNHSLRKDTSLVKEIADHIDARMEGLQNLIDTPAGQRIASAQDDKLERALFELSLVRDLIKDLTKGEE
jgi:hypothetical protein